MKIKFKAGDNVIVISGKCKKQIGKIREINNEAQRVFIEGVNLVKCFSKQKKQENKMKELSIHISNIAHVDPVSQKPTRVKIEVVEGAKRIIAKRSNTLIREMKMRKRES